MRSIMKRGMTPAEASRTGAIPRCDRWIRVGIKLGKIKADRIGRYDIIPPEEIERLEKDLPVITAREMLEASGG